MLNNEIYKKCIEDKIPIVRKNTLNYIIDIIKNNDYKTILEIGTAYGYSSYNFSLIDNVNKIDTLEKNVENYIIAKKFLKNIKKININNVNAFEYIPSSKYDFIFLDGPKSKQKDLLDKYIKYLNINGTIVIDNIYMKKFDNMEKLTKNQSSLLKKTKEFENYLQNTKEYNVKIIDIDDGIAIIKK